MNWSRWPDQTRVKWLKEMRRALLETLGRVNAAINSLERGEGIGADDDPLQQFDVKGPDGMRRRLAKNGFEQPKLPLK